MADFSYVISEDIEKGLVILVVEGELSKRDGERVIKETRKKAGEKGQPILCDISRAKIKASLADWFFLVRNKEIYPQAPAEKTAIVIDPGARDIFRFFENVTRNVGFKFRIFYRKEEAVAWLLEDK